MIDTSNSFDQMLTCIGAATKILESRDPISSATRGSLAELMRGLGKVIVEVEGMQAKIRVCGERLNR